MPEYIIFQIASITVTHPSRLTKSLYYLFHLSRSPRPAPAVTAELPQAFRQSRRTGYPLAQLTVSRARGKRGTILLCEFRAPVSTNLETNLFHLRIFHDMTFFYMFKNILSSKKRCKDNFFHTSFKIST